MSARALSRALVCEFLIGCLLAWSLTGCASMPRTGQASNGGPLRIVDRKVDDSRYEDVEVGKSDHYNSNGDYTGTSVQTQTQFVRDSHLEYDLLQGTTPIDAQDFMRISGDIQGAAKLESDRKQGVWLNHAGFPVAAVGLVAAYVGMQMRASSSGKAPLYTLMGGSMTASLGGLMIYFGQFKARPLKVLTGRRDGDMRILDRLDEDLKRPPAPASPASGSLPPTAPPASSAATSPSAEVVSRYATGSLPIAALRLVDAGGRTLAETHADGTLWAGAEPAEVGEIHGGSISWASQGNVCAVARDGSFYAFMGGREAELKGSLDPAGIYRDKGGDYYQVLKDGKIKSVAKGKSQILRSHFAAAVPARARALAAVLAAVYAKS